MWRKGKEGAEISVCVKERGIGEIKGAQRSGRRRKNHPNHQNKQGQTPGHFAVSYQFYDFASWLFDEDGGGGDDLLVNIFGLGPYDGLSQSES